MRPHQHEIKANLRSLIRGPSIVIESSLSSSLWVIECRGVCRDVLRIVSPPRLSGDFWIGTEIWLRVVKTMHLSCLHILVDLHSASIFNSPTPPTFQALYTSCSNLPPISREWCLWVINHSHQASWCNGNTSPRCLLGRLPVRFWYKRLGDRLSPNR